ncbi:nucleolar protein 4 isoform X3 [Rhipicephalus sanguineus]|uniref:nucleolar protein 4 isoform X3 n=1 Tax=Rhipicephalus sanguineus TaxID=34632 RepID=UPI0020C3BA94|nr:nucleolar protein 4 isoform X3 [Rhipicephalus sanguineus]
MEKRLHNTRHAARQARNSGKASNTASNRTTSGGTSLTTAERMTVNTTTTTSTSASPNSKAMTSAPSPPPAASPSANHHREQTSAPASSSRHRQQHQQSVKQSDSSDDDNEDEDEEMEDEAASSSPPGALATPTSPPSTPATPTGSAPSSSTSVTAPTTPSASPEQMYEGFQAWALRTYGDSAKTKTVTRKKYQRILKILKGEEQTSAENSKFRFWVKAKGFKMGLPPGHPQQSVHKAALAAAAAKTPPEQLLFVPCSKVKKGGDGETTVYKRVAVVENFFEIIYGVHVEMDGRGGKHAGQKRTYKAIAELYAFLPREAVTHFLMSCSDCQKRMHLTNGALSAIVTAAAAQGSAASSPAHNSGGGAPTTTPSTAAAPPPSTTTAETASSGYHSNGANSHNNNGASSCAPGSGGAGSRNSPSRESAGGAPAPAPSPARTSSAASSPGGAAAGDASAARVRAAGARIAAVSAADVDFSVPITTAYLKHMRSLGLSEEDAFNPREDSTLGSDELSDDEATPNYDDDEEASPDAGLLDSKETSDAHMADAASTTSPRPASEDTAGGSSAKTGGSPTTSASRRSCTDEPMDTQQPLNMTAKTTATTSLPGGSGFSVSGGSTAAEHSFADRGQSPPTAEPDDLSAGTKDEDEEDDDDEQDKLDISSYDPERLKAFNMFVRLFVDENLDRMVPISRQPKEKIQAIIDSCSRQFPEFAERARKRIRTYLKSCRRTKRTRDLNGWDVSMELDIPGRSTTPGYHVTVGVGGPNGTSTVLGVPASLSVNSSAASMTNNVSSQLISRLTAPIVSSNASATNGLLPTSLSSVTAGGPTALTAAVSSAVTTSGVDVTAVCPFHMHHHHQQQQQFHQHFAVATSANPSVTSNGILTSPGTVTSSSSSSSPVNSFMNGVVTGAPSPHTPHSHHHHKCFNNNVSATNGVGLTATVTSAANGHHYHVHHRHPGSLGGTSVSSSSCSGSNNNNSPTDLSVKKCVGNGVDSRPAVALKYSLNPAEVNAVKQLIAGYRESAAFLLRSADELEQLLLQQN